MELGQVVVAWAAYGLTNCCFPSVFVSFREVFGPSDSNKSWVASESPSNEIAAP